MSVGLAQAASRLNIPASSWLELHRFTRTTMASGGARKLSILPPSPKTKVQQPLDEDIPSNGGDILAPLKETRPLDSELPEAALGRRRSSVQFAVGRNAPKTAVEAPKAPPSKPQRRISSPPPPPKFQPRVAFDTFDNKDASTFSLTLTSKHREYSYSRRSRTFMCGADQNDYSQFALEWLIEELVDDGDEIVVLRVVDKDAKVSSESSVQEGFYKREAKRMLDQIIAINVEERHLSVILEFAVGKVHETFKRMIEIYEPAMLIVGTRGRSLGGIQGLLPGSVSKYCLQHSPVPVIVVRPTDKRERKKKKRQKDPSRQSYLSILEKSGANIGTGGHHLADRRNTTVLDSLPSQDEAAAVADALGVPSDLPDPDLPGRHIIIPHIITEDGEKDINAVNGLSPESSIGRSPISDQFSETNEPQPVMKSPNSENLPSPELSDIEDEDEDEEDEDEESSDEENTPHSETAIQSTPQHKEEVTQAAEQAKLKAQKVELENMTAGSKTGVSLDEDEEDEEADLELVTSRLALADAT